MNITEAHATQRVLDALMGRPVDLTGAAMSALELSGRARKALGAGKNAELSTVRDNLARIAGQPAGPAYDYGRLVAQLRVVGMDETNLALVARAAGRLGVEADH